MQISELDPSDDAGLESWYDVYRAALTDGREYPSAYALGEVRAGFRTPTPTQRHRPLLARINGEVVGVADVEVPLLENTSMVHVEICVRPSRWRQGIGTALLGQVEEIAHEEGRAVLVGEASYPYDAPPDGSGTPAGDFARRCGFSFGLADVQRVLALPVPEGRLEELMDLAAARHAGYSFRQFAGPAPDDVLPALAELRAAVETEAPMGDIARERGRVELNAARAEETSLAAQGRTRYTAVAVAPDGTLAGYTDLIVPELDPPWVYQWGTLVWSAHRGHRLGLALKVRNVAWLQREVPGRAAVRTWNAEVNDHMISVNEVMGFRPVERLGEFQKRLS